MASDEVVTSVVATVVVAVDVVDVTGSVDFDDLDDLEERVPASSCFSWPEHYFAPQVEEVSVVKLKHDPEKR